MRERTARDVAVRVRQRTGQVVPEHERAALARAQAQDAERAAGHGLVRFTACATVTVTVAGELEDACAALEADAAAARIELRRMWFAQDTGFAMGALPLGLGLPRRRWLTWPAARAPPPACPPSAWRSIWAGRYHVLPFGMKAISVRGGCQLILCRRGGAGPAPRAVVTVAWRKSTAPGLSAIDLGEYLGREVARAPVRDKDHKRARRVRDDPVPPRRGWARPSGGRAARLPAVPVFRGSTGQVQGLYPWLYGASMPPAGAYIGVDCLAGGAFSCHPAEWLRLGLIANPNIIVTGVPGSGKSATLKALAMRLMAYGVRCFVLGDLKNEYAPLARALGVEPVDGRGAAGGAPAR